MIGLNFYPQWSTKQLFIDSRGKLAFRETEPEGNGFGELIRNYYERYKVPVMITETSAVGNDEIRERWLDSSLHTLKTLRGEGVPVIGYTWFPLFTMVDWRYRFANADQTVEDFYLELGLYRLNRKKSGKRWQASPLVDKFKNYVNNSKSAVGSVRGKAGAA